MRYSPNINIIIKAIDKISGFLARDFNEIGNLQNNPNSAIKFANSCYKRIKEILIQNLTKFHPDYNIEFLDGQEIINNEKANYKYIIQPIDGLLNLSRSIPYFSTVIALEHNKEIIATVIFNITGNELLFCEKGVGTFLNDRQIRIPKHNLEGSNILCAADDKKLFNHPLINNSNFNFKLDHALSLDIAYLAAGRLDLCLINNKESKLSKLLMPIAKEAGCNINKKEDIVILSNNRIKI